MCSSFSRARSSGFSLFSSAFRLTSFIPSFHCICLTDDLPELRVDIFGKDVVSLALLVPIWVVAAADGARLRDGTGSAAGFLSALLFEGDFAIAGLFGIRLC